MTKKAKTDLETLEPVHLAPETVPAPTADQAKVNKSEEIRLEARRILDVGGSPRPRDIIEVLKSRGIEVVSPQVSQILGTLGVERRPRKKKSVAVSPRPHRAATVSYTHLTLPTN